VNPGVATPFDYPMTQTEQPTIPGVHVADVVTPGFVVRSRERSVSAIIHGSAAAAAGFGAVIASAHGLFGQSSPYVALAASLIGGGGLLYVGRAARHLLRFGSRRSAIGFGSAAALGTLAVLWPFEILLARLGVGLPPMWFRQLSGIGFLGLALVTLFFVLRTIARMVMPDITNVDRTPDTDSDFA
jgi:hypothetical protein